MVEYLSNKDDQWRSFVAAAMPGIIDDEIKGVEYNFFMDVDRCTAEEILTAIPQTHPKTPQIPFKRPQPRRKTP